MSMMVSFVLSFFPRDVLDEILNLIESVSEDFPSYSDTRNTDTIDNVHILASDDTIARSSSLNGFLPRLRSILQLKH